jgi:excisionase family DNA binding protein
VFEEEMGPSPYTIPQAARKLGMSEHAVRSAARRGELPAFKLGRDWRILPAKVDRLVSGEAAA